MTKKTQQQNTRGAMVGGAVTALLVMGGFAALALSSQNATPAAQSQALPDDALMLAQTGGPDDPDNPDAPPVAPPGGFPPPAGVPTTGGAAAAPVQDKKALANTSFRGMPDTYGTGATAPGGGFPGGGFPGGGAPGGLGPVGFGGRGGFGAAATNTGGAPTDWSKLKQYVSRGKEAPAAREDPFVSYRIPAYTKPDVQNFVAPIRIATRPTPPPPPPNPDPELRFGPLPFVPRRVAGILYNGSVSAILEIGQPGPGAEIFIVQPGSRVPSGISGPGLDTLTVASISPTQLVLRADDGRTVSVALSGAPNLSAGAAGGGFPGGVPGGVPGAPGRPGGAGFRGGFPGGGGAGGAGLDDR